MTNRSEYIAGLRQLADFLEANPDVPARGSWSVQYTASLDTTSHEEAMANVDRVAALLGVEPGYPWKTAHYQANKHFGPITYHAVAVKPAKPAKKKAQVPA